MADDADDAAAAAAAAAAADAEAAAAADAEAAAAAGTYGDGGGGGYDDGGDGGGGGYELGGGGGGDDGEYGGGEYGGGGGGGGSPSGGGGRGGPTLADVAGLDASDDVLTALPPFADAANKELHGRVVAARAALAAVAADGADHLERLTIMKEHLLNVKAELENAQGVLNARLKEKATEEHLKALTERAVGRMRQEIAALEARSEGVAAQVAATQAAIYKGSERLDGFREAMHLAQGELEEYAARARAKEEDNLALEKYTKADNLKVRDLTREQERLTVAVAEARRALESAVTETKAKQVELDKLADDFRALHAERQALVTQWQDNVALLAKRDGDVARAAEHLARAKAAVVARRAKVAEQEALVARLEGDNAELEVTIASRQRAVAAARESEKVLTERVNRFRDAVELLKTNVSAAAGELAAKRTGIAAAGTALEGKRGAVEAARRAVEDIRARLAHATAQVASSESALAERESYMEREGARVAAAERRLALLKDQLFKANEAVKKLREEESVLGAEILGSRRTARNLADRIKDLDAQSLAQQEHVYAAEFQIQQMERKIARAKGEVSDEEKKILQARIGELGAELAEATELERGLTAQNKAVKDDLKKALRAQASLTARLAEVQARIDELLLQNRSAEEGLHKAVKDKEEAMVAHDVLKLEIRKLRDALSCKTDEVFGLENRGAQLAMTVEARKREIEAERAIVRASGKLVEEERHKLALDLTDRQAKIGLLQAKYEALCARMRGSDDGGEPRSQAYFLLKAAQRREELQREGDELDAAIRKGEREVKALAATLTHLAARNTALREAFHRADPSSDEAASVRLLEQQLKDAADGVFKRKRELASLQSQVEEGTAKLMALADRASTLTAQLDGLGADETRVAADRDATAAALEATRARLEERRASHRTRMHEAARRPAAAAPPAADEPTPYELSLLAQGVKECNASVLFTLGQLAREFPQMQSTLASRMAELALRMPAKPPARGAGGAPPAVPRGAGAARGAAGGAAGVAAAGAGGRTVAPSLPPAAPAPSAGLAGSLRRPPSSSSLTGAGRTILAGPPGGGGGGGGAGSRPGSARSLSSKDGSVGGRSAGGGSGGGGGGGSRLGMQPPPVDLGLSGVRVGSAGGSRR